MGCEGCAKVVLIAFNIVFFLIGAAALGVGIWVAVDGTIFFDLLANIPDSSAIGNLISQAAYILIAVGGTVFLIAFLGCCGAWKKNKCLLVVYAIIISVILLVEIAAVVIAAVFSDRIVEPVKQNLGNALGSTNTYKSTFTPGGTDGTTITYSSSDLLSKAIDIVQMEYMCCGINGASDYDSVTIPATCCSVTESDDNLKTIIDKMWADGGASFTITDASCYQNATYVANTQGCYDSIYNYISGKSMIFIGIGAGILVIQLVLIILACCLCCSIGKEGELA